MEGQLIENGLIHVHSEHSMKDSAVSIKALIKKALELGSPAITLTDHGTLTGIDEFMTLSKELGIKAIPGVELYVQEDASVLKRAHMILLAKNATNGYRDAISKVVTETNTRIDTGGFPRANKAILEKYIGEGSIGHGHVIGTSACMNGSLSNLLLSGFTIMKEIEKLKEKQKKAESPDSPSYKKNVATYKENEVLIDNLTKQRDELSKIAKKTFTKKVKTVDGKKGTPEYDVLKAELDKEMQESKDAAEEVEDIKKKIKTYRTQLTLLNRKIKDSEKDHEKWNSIQAEIDLLSKSIKSEEELYVEAKEEALELERIFGKGNFYIELQYHGIPEEAYVMPKLAQLAEELGLPVVAANDVHTLSDNKDDLKARQIMRSLRFNKWEEQMQGDDQLYMKTDKELKAALTQILHIDVVEKAMKGIGDIVNACNVEFTKEEHYPVFRSDIPGEDAVTRLRRLAKEGIEWRYPSKNGWTEEHSKRMEYELEIITEQGFCDYLCIVEDFLRHGRILGRENAEKVGIGIGPGRGSAVGSLVCYLIGITGIDPMKYGLLFERFLNRERVSMPDIDSDFKTDIRDTVIEYVKDKYGKNAVCSILTKGTQAVKGALKNCARLLGDEKYGDSKAFLSLGDQLSKAVPDELGITFDDCYDGMVDRFRTDANALEILANARLVEGTLVSHGMHAAGVIISDNSDVSDYTPLMYDNKYDRWKTQCDMIEAEDKGLLKMDFLGLNNLDIITESLRNIKRRTGESIDIEYVSLDEIVFEKIFATGNTNSIFQFESNGMKQMLRQFKPNKIEDIILLVAAYRPGPMQFLDDIIAVKHGRKKPEYIIPEMEEVLGVTYGYPVYQEQIMQIFNRFAGFTLGESDIIRRYMSKKKTEKFMAYKDKFVNGMVERGADRAKTEEFWTQLVEFSKYAFNKSHACAYAFVAYYTAWLKHYYPTEYLCAVMNNTPMEKIPGLMADCKKFGIEILPPDITDSEQGFSVKGNAILFGLSSIKNVGNSAALIIEEREKHGNYITFHDFLKRGHVKKDATESLIGAGALDRFSKNRYAMMIVLEKMLKVIKKINDKKKEIETETNDKRLERAQKAYNDAIKQLSSENIPDELPEDHRHRLEKEKELLGVYVSSHPLDEYQTSEELGCIPINELVPKRNIYVMGMITDLRKTTRKSDGAPMAFFTLEDRTGRIEVNCFTKAFAEYGEEIEEGNIVKILCNCTEEESFFEDEEMILKLGATRIQGVNPVRKSIRLFVNNIIEWTEVLFPMIRAFQCGKEGHPLLVCDKAMNEVRTTDIYVSPSILKNESKLSVFMS